MRSEGNPKAGTLRFFKSVQGLTVTTNIFEANDTSFGIRGCAAATTYLVNVKNIGAGDTWTLDYAANISQSAGHILGTIAVTAPGLYVMTPSATTGMKLFPNRLRITKTVDGGTPNLDADFYLLTADRGRVIDILTDAGSFSGALFSVDIPVNSPGGSLHLEGGGARNMTLMLGVQAVVGTWDIKAYADLAGTIQLGQQIGITTALSNYINPVAPWDALEVNQTIPLPKMIRVTNTAGASPTLTLDKIVLMYN